MALGITESKLLELKSKNNVVVVDLRKKQDFAKAHIKGSILANYDEKSLLTVSGNPTVVLVSDNAEQSKNMANALHAQGFDVYFLEGGLKNWTRGFYCTNISYVGTNYLRF